MTHTEACVVNMCGVSYFEELEHDNVIVSCHKADIKLSVYSALSITHKTGVYTDQTD